MFVAEVFDNDATSWADIKDKIVALEQEAFETEPFTPELLEEDFLNSQSIIVLLRNPDTREVIGFTYAKPEDPTVPDSPAQPGETVCMWDTVIQKEYRGKGFLGVMMQKLEEELGRRGFKYIERQARTANNFAANIEKHYKDRIIKSFPLDSKWGPQIFFRIKL